LATHLAWQPDKIDFQPFLKNYVERRYGQELIEPMLEAWEKIVKAIYCTRNADGLRAYADVLAAFPVVSVDR